MLRAMACLERALALALLVGLPSACGDDGSAASQGDDASSAGASSGDATTSSSPSTGAEGSATQASDPSTSGPATIGTGVDSTTGTEMLCNGWSEDGPDEPWLELYDVQGQPLASGGTYALTCGGQGSWMFPIFPRMGGFVLTQPLVVFSVEVTVEGFPGPFGPFYREPQYYYGLECFEDTFDGGFAHDCIAVLPPDDIADLAALDGAPATIHLELEVGGGDPIVVDLVDMTLSAPPDIVAGGCVFL
jgi:hypothetical protein